MPKINLIKKKTHTIVNTLCTSTSPLALPFPRSVSCVRRLPSPLPLPPKLRKGPLLLLPKLSLPALGRAPAPPILDVNPHLTNKSFTRPSPQPSKPGARSLRNQTTSTPPRSSSQRCRFARSLVHSCKSLKSAGNAKSAKSSTVRIIKRVRAPGVRFVPSTNARRVKPVDTLVVVIFPSSYILRRRIKDRSWRVETRPPNIAWG